MSLCLVIFEHILDLTGKRRIQLKETFGNILVYGSDKIERFRRKVIWRSE